ncbi:MAG: hypothetical protein V2J24_06045 [Pseudomonadales bacterium]|jgi:hypothetical protein|nr:hypothetical protein [Pseudomonadales bacterium]
MNDTVRAIIAVVTCVFLWGLCWNLGNAGAAAVFPDELAGVERIEAPGLLLMLVGYSILLSIGAGWLAAFLGRAAAATAVLVLGTVNLAIGIAVQTAYWDMMPLWYHLLFLACVLPATLVGGRLHGFPPNLNS